MSKRILGTILQWFYLTLACQFLLRALKPLSACILWQVHIILLLRLNKQIIDNYVRLFLVCRAGQWRQVHSHTAGGDDARDCFRHGLSSRHGICTQGEYRLCLVRWMSFISKSAIVVSISSNIPLIHWISLMAEWTLLCATCPTWVLYTGWVSVDVSLLSTVNCWVAITFLPGRHWISTQGEYLLIFPSCPLLISESPLLCATCPTLVLYTGWVSVDMSLLSTVYR